MNPTGRSPLTLFVASASSAAAAVVVRELWAPGTIASAALTPMLVALFAELLHRPAHRLTHAARERLKGWHAVSLRSIDPIARIPSLRQRVLSTAGVAFLIASVALTGWELSIHHSPDHHAHRDHHRRHNDDRPDRDHDSAGRDHGHHHAATAPVAGALSTVGRRRQLENVQQSEQDQRPRERDEDRAQTTEAVGEEEEHDCGVTPAIAPWAGGSAAWPGIGTGTRSRLCG